MIICTFQDDNITPMEAARRFAAEWWAEPRKIRNPHREDTWPPLSIAFGIVGGHATYRIDHDDTHGWVVKRLVDSKE